MADETTRSPAHAPHYALHRSATAADPATVTEEKLGMNMASNDRAHVQVVPSGGANPSVEVQFWSAGAGAFISEHTPITFTGKGANVPFEFTVECRERIMLVKLTVLATGKAMVYVAGAGTEKR